MLVRVFDLLTRVASFCASLALPLICHGTALATEATALQICAARDVKTVILIEDHGEANEIASSRIAEAGLMQMRARLACKDGRTDEGIAIYDEINRLLGDVRQARP